MFHRPLLPLDRNVTVANLVDELLKRQGDRVVSRGDDFVALDGRKAPVQRLSELHAEICALGRFLVEDAGLRPGGLVGIWRTNDHRCFRWFLAVIRAGGIAVPLNPLLTLPEVRRIVDHCGLSILVTDASIFQKHIVAREQLPVSTWIQSDQEAATLAGFLRVAPERLRQPPLAPVPWEPEKTVAIFHTSGTQGIPKGVALSSRALLAGRVTAALFSPFRARDSLALIALPWSHIMAVSTALCGLMAGVAAYCQEHFDTERVIATIERHKITALVGVPAMLAKLVNAQPPPEKLASIRLWLSASDHLPCAVRDGLLEYGALVRLPFGMRLKPVLLNAYGMVELGGIAMIGVHSTLIPGGTGLYFPVPPFRVRVAREDGRTAARGETGECLVKGPGLNSGYWKNPAATAMLVGADGWLCTGDLAVRNALGLIRLVGRSKDVIKCGGYSLYAGEIEEVLNAHPAVARAAVVGLPNAEMGEVPVGAVEPREGATVTEEELLAWCRKRLATFKAPRRIHVLARNSMPLGVTQKVLKNDLRVRLAREPRESSTPPAVG
jgi:long-chain acyl-CoA synthetase